MTTEQPTLDERCARCGHTKAAHELPSINVCSLFLPSAESASATTASPESRTSNPCHKPITSYCTKPFGHAGPCARLPVETPATPVAEIVLSLARFARHNSLCPVAQWQPQDAEDSDRPECTCGLNLLLEHAKQFETVIHAEKTPAALCSHGFVLTENVCGPCSQGKPNVRPLCVFREGCKYEPKCAGLCQGPP